jgi:hypothetical protein
VSADSSLPLSVLTALDESEHWAIVAATVGRAGYSDAERQRVRDDRAAARETLEALLRDMCADAARLDWLNAQPSWYSASPALGRPDALVVAWPAIGESMPSLRAAIDAARANSSVPSSVVNAVDPSRFSPEPSAVPPRTPQPETRP